MAGIRRADRHDPQEKKPMSATRRFLTLLAIPALLALATPAARAVTAEDAEANVEMWNKVRDSLFANRTISEQADPVIALEAPPRAEDASTVPIAIRTMLPQSAARYVQKIYLIIDNNPSPVGAIFSFTPESGRADLETRVRIEEYTHIRAIAELSDGALFMAKRFVRGSYGCSAPGGKDDAQARARMGRMKLRISDPITPDQPVQAQLMISHPNDSGLVMDQLSRLYEPSNFVRRIEVTYAGRPVMTADVDFTISQNPNFRFYFIPKGEGELKATVVDSRESKFESSLAIHESTIAAH
jgi:sulfur-oxidizing protein SoxY